MSMHSLLQPLKDTIRSLLIPAWTGEAPPSDLEHDLFALLQPLKDTIRNLLIPAWTGKAPPSDLKRDLFVLPARLEGLGIVNQVTLSSKDFPASVTISAPLCDLIEYQQADYPRRFIAAQLNTKKDVHK